jgi:catechol 2,3-dioxygenase-like lactoylglutathione lyase family enzyme
MARIVHIALKVADLETAGGFYERVFGFKRVDEGQVRDHTSQHLSDGTIDLALIKYHGDTPEGLLSGKGPCIHHFGIEVEDLEASVLELKAAGCEIISPPGELPVKFRDVSGVVAELVPVGRYKTP